MFKHYGRKEQKSTRKTKPISKDDGLNEGKTYEAYLYEARKKKPGLYGGIDYFKE